MPLFGKELLETVQNSVPKESASIQSPSEDTDRIAIKKKSQDPLAYYNSIRQSKKKKKTWMSQKLQSEEITEEDTLGDKRGITFEVCMHIYGSFHPVRHISTTQLVIVYNYTLVYLP